MQSNQTAAQAIAPQVTTPQTTPWYRIGMVWLMMGLPFVVVVASLVTAKIAHQNAPTIIHADDSRGTTAP